MVPPLIYGIYSSANLGSYHPASDTRCPHNTLPRNGSGFSPGRLLELRGAVHLAHVPKAPPMLLGAETREGEALIAVLGRF